MEQFYDLDGNPLKGYKFVETRPYKPGEIIERGGKKYKIIGEVILTNGDVRLELSEMKE